MQVVSASEHAEHRRVCEGKHFVPADLGGEAARTLLRVALFLAIIAALVWGLDATISAGLRSMPTSLYRVTNRIVAGSINAQIIITGSSRAASHFDPRIIHRTTGYTTFNLGRNGSQTDMQLAVLKTYLKHNRRPDIVVHNLDAFTFQTTHEIYNPAQYIPYLNEEELYRPLEKINPNIWKSRYLPLYGYVAEDMSFAWIQGLKALLPLPQRENLIDGFDPRETKWTGEFERFKESKRDDVRWDIEPEGIRLTEELVHLCRTRGIQLIFVYSPEYSEMQAMTKNRKEIFGRFREIAFSQQVPLWDYSNWRHAADTEYFTNSQHLNANGAGLFSLDVATELKRYIEEQSSAARSNQRDLNAGDAPQGDEVSMKR
jgi:hypothetical protein